MMDCVQEACEFRRIFGLEKLVSKHAQKECVFYFHNILTLDSTTKTSSMRYEDNLSKDYNLLKSHFMWKATFRSPNDNTCGSCLAVQKKQNPKSKNQK